MTKPYDISNALENSQEAIKESRRMRAAAGNRSTWTLPAIDQIRNTLTEKKVKGFKAKQEDELFIAFSDGTSLEIKALDLGDHKATLLYTLNGEDIT